MEEFEFVEVHADNLHKELQKVRRLVVLTGAGMSTESGLPDFRSADGLWRNHRPEELASVDALVHHPLLFYEFYRYRLELLEGVAPNPGHKALVELEKQGRLECIVTQNVDGLHSAAGSRKVTEIHGTLREARCHDCEKVYSADVLKKPVSSLEDVPRCDCGGMIRPGVVLFGEALPEKALRQATEAVEHCDALLVIGTSLQVYPAASLPQIALDHGARLWIINLAPTSYDASADLVIQEKAAEVLSRI